MLEDDSFLVGGFNPSEKYARQIGSFPQVGMKIKNIWNHHLVLLLGSLGPPVTWRIIPGRVHVSG